MLETSSSSKTRTAKSLTAPLALSERTDWILLNPESTVLILVLLLTNFKWPAAILGFNCLFPVVYYVYSKDESANIVMG